MTPPGSFFYTLALFQNLHLFLYAPGQRILMKLT
jgi:hypothetical protein